MTSTNGVDSKISEINFDSLLNIKSKLSILKDKMNLNRDKVTINNVDMHSPSNCFDVRDDPQVVLQKIRNIKASSGEFVEAHSGLNLDRVLKLLDFD